MVASTRPRSHSGRSQRIGITDRAHLPPGEAGHQVFGGVAEADGEVLAGPQPTLGQHVGESATNRSSSSR